MELNSFLFPAPQSSYTMQGAIGDLIYIPRIKIDEQTKKDYQIQQEKLRKEKEKRE